MTREANVVIPVILLALTAFHVASAQLPPTTTPTVIADIVERPSR